MRNAVEEKRFVKQQDTEGSPFFVLRAGNKQEIARSRAFASLTELEKGQAYLVANLTLVAPLKKERTPTISAHSTVVSDAVAPVKAVPNAPTESMKDAQLAGENADLKHKIAELETRVLALLSALTGKDTDIAPARQVFRIELYQSAKGGRLLGKIHHVLSGDARPFAGLDNEAINHFITSKLALKDAQMANVVDQAAGVSALSETSEVSPKSPISPISSIFAPLTLPTLDVTKPVIAAPIKVETAVATASTSETHAPPTQASAKYLTQETALLTIKIAQKSTNAVCANAAFEVSFCPNAVEKRQILVGTTSKVQLYAYLLGSRERFLLLEKDVVIADEPCITVNVQQNSLRAGSYRLTLTTIHTRQSDATRLSQWHGTALMQVFLT